MLWIYYVRVTHGSFARTNSVKRLRVLKRACSRADGSFCFLRFCFLYRSQLTSFRLKVWALSRPAHGLIVETQQINSSVHYNCTLLGTILYYSKCSLKKNLFLFALKRIVSRYFTSLPPKNKSFPKLSSAFVPPPLLTSNLRAITAPSV